MSKFFWNIDTTCFCVTLSDEILVIFYFELMPFKMTRNIRFSKTAMHFMFFVLGQVYNELCCLTLDLLFQNASATQLSSHFPKI